MRTAPRLLMLCAFGLVLAGAGLWKWGTNNGASLQASQTHEAEWVQATLPTTSQDFYLPGSQPHQMVDELVPADNCSGCHSGYSSVTGQPQETETWRAWSGSMMAQAGRDPVFFAALDIANADAAQSGEWCLRCHMASGWLEGRSSTADGSEMTADDREGVQCSVCHRLVDPEYSEGNPARDMEVLAGLNEPVTTSGSGAMIADPLDHRRGPFDVVADLGNLDPHLLMGARETLVSPFHQSGDLCGTCHDITNPLFTWDPESGSYEPNELDQAGDPAAGFPIERTYSEWRLSAYNSPPGIYAPQFGGNKNYVSSCQDCHMRDITGAAGAFFGNRHVIREDMPLHDLTGANTWVPQIIPDHPEFGLIFTNDPDRRQALDDGIERARTMLQNAAWLDVIREGDALTVTVINRSGHKLPTGYVEGRRMWLQVEGYDAGDNLIFSSGAYDKDTGILDGYQTDPDLKVYESKHGLTEAWAEQLGLDAGSSFHFALNNMIVSDNRIPPQGYQFETFNAAAAAPYTDGQPDPELYQDGQFWDTTTYTLPDGVVRGAVRLLYQTSSKEYIEFLRDNAPDGEGSNGHLLYDLWQENGRSEPETMAEREFQEMTYRDFVPAVSGP